MLSLKGYGLSYASAKRTRSFMFTLFLFLTVSFFLTRFLTLSLCSGLSAFFHSWTLLPTVNQCFDCLIRTHTFMYTLYRLPHTHMHMYTYIFGVGKRRTFEALVGSTP